MQMQVFLRIEEGSGMTFEEYNGSLKSYKNHYNSRGELRPSRLREKQRRAYHRTIMYGEGAVLTTVFKAGEQRARIRSAFSIVLKGIQS